MQSVGSVCVDSMDMQQISDQLFHIHSQIALHVEVWSFSSRFFSHSHGQIFDA